MLQYREQQKMSGDRFHASAGNLVFSTQSVELRLAPGESAEGTFTVTSKTDGVIHGFVLSDRTAMKVVTPEFSGSGDEIGFRFDASAFEAGTKVDGALKILSNQGEYRLPYHVEVVPLLIDSSLGPVRNLFHFTNLARTNWKEAVSVYYRKQFRACLSDAGPRERLLYRGLSTRPGNEQDVEEFLISINRKKPVVFLPDRKELTLEIPSIEKEPVSGSLSLKKNGWGYVSLKIVPDADFLNAVEQELTEADFSSGSFSYLFSIDPARLHAGLNFGRILLVSPYDTREISLRVSFTSATALKTLYHRERQKLILALMKAYLSYREQKTGSRELIEKAGPLITKLAEADRNNVLTSLYRIHYLITAHKYEDAVWDLKALNTRLSGLPEGQLPFYSTAQFDLEEDESYAYRMYLTALCAQEDTGYEGAAGAVSDAIRAIDRMHRKNPSDFWITWLCLYASEEAMKRPSRAWEMLREAYGGGSRSPLLYIEAFQMISMNPAILHGLDEFALQVLWFAAGEQILTTGVMTQVNYLAIREKTFSRRLYHILTAGYDLNTLQSVRRETLESICALLIRGNETDSRFFPWYQKGVEQGLSLTRLFEYYMMAMPEDYSGEIPQMVLLYFAYQSTLPLEKNALLYHYVEDHRQALGETADRYENQIRPFTETQLLQHAKGTHLFALYQYDLLDAGHVITDDLASASVPSVFACHVSTGNPGLKRAVVVYGALSSEQYFPLEAGEGIFPVYADPDRNQAALFFEDNTGRRYAGSVSHKLTRVMDLDRILPVLAQYEVDSFGYDLYRAGCENDGPEVTERTADGCCRLLSGTGLQEQFRSRIQVQLLEYYERRNDPQEMLPYLQSAEPESLSPAARDDMVRFMTSCGMAGKALTWINRYGTGALDGKSLLALCRALEDTDDADDLSVTRAAYAAFRKGSYDENTLTLLMKNADDLSEELNRIREAAIRYGLDDYMIARRMLIQLLYTGEKIPQHEDVLRTCMTKGADTGLTASALAQRCHWYFTENVPVAGDLFDQVAAYGLQGIPLLDICRIAWLKDRSERSGEIPDRDLEVTSVFLQDLLDEEVIFPFFRQFIGILPELQAFADETLVQYQDPQGRKNTHIIYHYAMEKNGVREKYRTRDMKEMYDGVYVTGFLLFFGEQMHYYITDDTGEKHIVESGTVGQDARIPAVSDDRFGLVNEISMLASLGRDEEAVDKIDAYSRRSFLVKKIFEKDDHSDAV